MAGLHFIRISCFVRAFNKEFHVVHAFHKPYGFMKCHLSHPPGIQRGMYIFIYVYIYILYLHLNKCVYAYIYIYIHIFSHVFSNIILQHIWGWIFITTSRKGALNRFFKSNFPGCWKVTVHPDYLHILYIHIKVLYILYTYIYICMYIYICICMYDILYT